MYVCMYVCMYVWMDVCMYGWMRFLFPLGSPRAILENNIDTKKEGPK